MHPRAFTQIHTPTLLLVNMSRRTVFTMASKWVWGSGDSGEWPQGLTGCWGGGDVSFFCLTSLVTSRDIKKSFYTQRDIHTHTHAYIADTHRRYASIKNGPALMSSEEVSAQAFSLSPSSVLDFGRADADDIKRSPERLHLAVSLNTTSRTRTRLSLLLIHCLPGGKTSAERHKWQK